ncbi:MAG: tyrosine-type recombinase/integrase [Rhodothermales bacterium]
MSEHHPPSALIIPAKPAGAEAVYAAMADPGTNLLAAFLHKHSKKNTEVSYRNDIAQFFSWSENPVDPPEPTDFVNALQVGAITFLHANEYLRTLEVERKLKPSTVARKIASLRSFFDFCIALQIVNANPFNKHTLRTVAKHNRDQIPVFLSASEARRLLAATSLAGEAAVRDRALILTMLHTVIRRSEASMMNVEHIRPVGAFWVLDIPASKSGNKWKKVPAHVVEEIEDYKKHYDIVNGPLWRSLSNRSKHERLSPGAIYRMIKRTARQAGFPSTIADRIGAHTLRHSGISIALENGATIQEAQEHAGHASVETTMIYVHRRNKLEKNAADKINLG